jgi:choline-sulfatase
MRPASRARRPSLGLRICGTRLGPGAVIFLLCAGAGLAQQTPVILISIDTLRADHLSAYGYRKVQTLNIDSFAQPGTVFTAIDSQIPLTLPSHTSLFTSTYPFANGIEENTQRVPAGVVTLATVLRAHGYQTAAFIGSILLDQSTGISQGFEAYDSPFHAPEGATPNLYSLRVRRDGALVALAARRWLEAHRRQPVFAFLHFFDLHTPYSMAPPGDAIPETMGYDAELRYLDQVLGRFRQALIGGGWWDRSLVVLLSDHGEGLGDHGESSHGYFVYQSTIWVPLLIHWPSGHAGYAARISQPGGLIDVAPTILDFLGLPKPPSFSGESLLRRAEHAVYSESMYPRDAFQWAPLRSLRSDGWQYIQAPKPELYQLQTDPGEAKNVAATDGSQTKTLQQELAKLLQRFNPIPEAAKGTSSKTNPVLGSLGYVGVGTRADQAGPRPDPKDRLPEFNAFEKALAALYAGRAPSAVLRFRQLLRLDPQNAMARYYLGEAYLRDQQPDNAIREWTATLRQDPENIPAEEALGSAWLQRQDYARARGYFQQALAAAPNDYPALLRIGIAEEHLNLLPEAKKHLEAACAVEPDAVECQQELRRLRGETK